MSVSHSVRSQLVRSVSQSVWSVWSASQSVSSVSQSVSKVGQSVVMSQSVSQRSVDRFGQSVSVRSGQSLTVGSQVGWCGQSVNSG